jgi:hypothetical protein
LEVIFRWYANKTDTMFYQETNLLWKALTEVSQSEKGARAAISVTSRIMQLGRGQSGN